MNVEMRIIGYITQRLTLFNIPCRSYCNAEGTIKHVYDNVAPFKTNKQLADYLCDNIFYNKNGIIVLNKPYGICFSRDPPQWKNDNKSKPTNVIKHKSLDYSSITKPLDVDILDSVNLHGALPYIKSNLNCDSLCIIRSPEKYTTGVAILGRSEDVRMKIIKCWERSKSERIPIESYLAICSGIPIKGHINHMLVGVTLDVSENGKAKRAILTKKYSRRSVLKSLVKLASVSFHLLNSNENGLASLVKLECNQKKWHFVRLFLASQLLSPAIGDHMFSSRVKTVMGTRVPVNHWNECTSQPQKLDMDLLKKLDLLPGSEKYIPSMIHLSSVRLLGYLKSDDEVISVPPPLHFNWTLNKLNLQLPDEGVKQLDTNEDDNKKALAVYS